MKTLIGFIIIATTLISCKQTKPKQEIIPIVGTWQFISGTTIKKDTTVVDYRKNQTAIKIINATHFAFLIHDLTKGKESNPNFVAGGGRCSLEGNKYIEHLEYCNYREWEGINVEFTATIKDDTLTLTGIEKSDIIGVNQIIIEKYIRLN